MSEKSGDYEAQKRAQRYWDETRQEAERQRQQRDDDARQYDWDQAERQHRWRLNEGLRPHDYQRASDQDAHCKICGTWEDHPNHTQRAESATDLVTPDMGEGELEEIGQGITADHIRDTFGPIIREADEWRPLAKWISEAIEYKQRIARAQAFREAAELCEEKKGRVDVIPGFNEYESGMAFAYQDCIADLNKFADEAEKG